MQSKSNITHTSTIIQIQGNFNYSINDFLAYICDTKDKELVAQSGYASSNGTSSFLIENYTTVKTKYYYNGEFTTETVDLIFCGYNKFSAKYINKSGQVPYAITGTGNLLSITVLNEWKSDVRFVKNQTISLKSQYKNNNTNNIEDIVFKVVLI